jgi:hypothetical protein
MSVSCHASFCVGTTADELFDSVGVDIRDVFEIHDVKSGKPTGRMSPGERWVVAELHDGKKIEQKGSNEFDLRDWLENTLGSKIGFYYDYERDDRTLSHLFVGMTVADGDCYENKNIIVDQNKLNEKREEVKRAFEKIGYDGEIQMALVTSCG